MAYDGYGKRQRMDGNSYGMAPPSKRMADYGSMSHGRGNSYHDYPSPQQKMSRSGSGSGGHEEKPSNVLFFTVYNPKYPITVDVMHTITSPHGTVNRIVIFRKNGVQSMVEFETIEEADRAKEALNGADIYSGCCTLKVEWGKPTRLNVMRNDTDTWDYTNPNLGKEMPKSQPLLPDPSPGYGGGGSHMEPPPSRRGPPMDYGYDDYNAGEPYDAYGPPRGGLPPGPGPNRYPGSREPVPGPNYDEMYGPPRPQMRGAGPMAPRRGGPMRGGGGGGGMPRGGGPPRGPMPPMSNFDEDRSGGGGMLQQGSVLMVYGLNAEKMNCQRLFNMFCLYGNVVRIKFLKSKEGVAMVQMGDNASCNRAITNLNHSYIFDSKLGLGISKQAFIQDVPNPIDLPDGSPSFLDYMGSRNNRFTTPEAAAKNRIQPASKSLYFFNAPPNLDEEAVRKLFEDLDVTPPSMIKTFASKSERSSTGLLEWDTNGEAIEALVVANHTPLSNPSGKTPFIFKLCFSAPGRFK